jgi:hypothetical protein
MPPSEPTHMPNTRYYQGLRLKHWLYTGDIVTLVERLPNGRWLRNGDTLLVRGLAGRAWWKMPEAAMRSCEQRSHEAIEKAGSHR